MSVEGKNSTNAFKNIFHQFAKFIILEVKSDFCKKKINGNYIDPGLSKADPRCTYVTCSNTQTFLFHCPQGRCVSIYIILFMLS